jgi:hypothetical protein
LSAGREVWANYVASGTIALALRAKFRTDKTPDEWGNFVSEVAWLDPSVTRASESTHDSVRNPNSRNDTELYRIHWLEGRIEEAVKQINKLGKAKFPDNHVYADGMVRSFSLSWKLVVALRHFSVREAKRNSCLCRYHLQFSHLASALFSARIRAKATAGCTCPNPRDPFVLRRLFVCRPQGPESEQDLGDLFEPRACVNSTCEHCPGLDGVIYDLEKQALSSLRSKFPSWEASNYVRKDGTIKKSSDFVLVEKFSPELLDDIRTFLPSFLKHHDRMKWQGRDMHLKRKPPRKSFSSTCHV